jgi:hypothetical protein
LFLAAEVDVEADLRTALAQEQLDAAQLVPAVLDTVRKLWEGDSCRQFLRGELAKFAAAKIDWNALVQEYKAAEAMKKNGETAVRDYVETKASLTPGAASAVSRHVYHQIQVSRGTLPLSCALRN